jgi:hypothetical protein
MVKRTIRVDGRKARLIWPPETEWEFRLKLALGKYAPPACTTPFRPVEKAQK